jgi:hypothetical protein
LVWWENLKQRDELEDGKIITKVILKSRVGGLGLDLLVPYRNQMQAVLNMIMNHWDP